MLSRLNTTAYYLPISVGQEFRSGFAGWFWLRVFCEAVVQSSEGSTGS